MGLEAYTDVSRAKVAKYLRIESDILAAIKDGSLKPGDKLPGQSEMCSRYGVSAITVRKAFADLINDGYLVGIRGSGTYVAKRQMIRGLTSISFSEELREQGYEVGMVVDAISSGSNPIAARHLGMDEATEFTKVTRVRIANDEPVAFHVSYIPNSLLTVEQAQGLQEIGSFYDMLARYDIFPQLVNENYSVKTIDDPHVCSALGVGEDYPSFFVRRTTFDQDNVAVEYSETYFNKDWYSVTVNIRA